MKKVIIVILIFILITGCKNKEENEKNNYLTMKSNLLERKKYTNLNDLPCDITIDIKRKNKEEISYKVTLDNPKEDMNNIKLITVHNYYTEDAFPSIGFLNEKKDLKTNTNKDITLKGKIETTEDIDNLNLQIKIYLEYKTNDNKTKEIYYKTT